jgi:hypothetical protein
MIKHALYCSARDAGERSGTRSERLHPESVISTELLRGGRAAEQFCTGCFYCWSQPAVSFVLLLLLLLLLLLCYCWEGQLLRCPTITLLRRVVGAKTNAPHWMEVYFLNAPAAVTPDNIPVPFCAEAGEHMRRSRYDDSDIRILWVLNSWGPGSIPGTTRKKVVGLERGPLSLVSTTEELLDGKVATPV